MRWDSMDQHLPAFTAQELCSPLPRIFRLSYIGSKLPSANGVVIVAHNHNDVTGVGGGLRILGNNN